MKNGIQVNIEDLRTDEVAQAAEMLARGIGVEAELPGRGIGTQMMEVFCRRMDVVGEAAYLETDKAENVRFYGRFGFATLDEPDIHGIHNWFMFRP